MASPSPRVDVELTARGASKDLGVWRFARAPALVRPPEATDDAGALAVSRADDAGGARLVLGRGTRGNVTLRYTVAGAPPAYPEVPAVAVDPDRFDASLEALIAIPEAFDAREIHAEIGVDLQHVGAPQYSDAASSLGVGRVRRATLRGRDLARGQVVGGLIGKARLEAPEGHDEAAWLGYTAFDPRPAIADLAGFRTAARQIFGDRGGGTLTFLVITDARPVGAFTAGRRGDSIALRVGMAEPWSAAVRIATAAEVLREWIGARLWVGPAEPAREAEAYWFTEGVTRALARDLLFRFGLLAPAELAAELEGLAGVAATSPLRDKDNQALAKLPRGALPLVVARGALYATRVDAQLRKRSKGSRSLPSVLRALYDEAGRARGPLPAEAWVAAIVKELGEAERGAFRDAIELGRPVELPEGALGPCFRRVNKTYAAFDVGFDADASRAKKSIAGVVPGGPAHAAGLRDGDALVELTITAGRSDVPVTVIVDRGGQKTIRYRPAGATGRGVGWERKTDVPDAACAG